VIRSNLLFQRTVESIAALLCPIPFASDDNQLSQSATKFVQLGRANQNTEWDNVLLWHF
jgi:hypothetical protein